MNKKTLFLLFTAFFFACLLRFYQLSSFPVGFHIDEASLGYNAYSLLITGRDENNHALPLYIDTFGDNRPTGYNYLTILPVKYFGLTVFATRFISALFGSITVFAFFFLVYFLFKNKNLALISSILIAAAPWHVVLSRASAEAIVALFFIISGFALIFLSFKENKQKYLSLGGVLLAISFFFYHTPRVFVPILLFTTLAYYFLKNKIILKSHRSIPYLITFILISALAFSLVFQIKGGTGRFNQVNIFGAPETNLVMQEQIREDGSAMEPVFFTRIFHNKILNYSLTFISNYLSYFDANFLFIKGGLPIWYNVPNMGLIYLVELPFFIYGLFLLLAKKEWFSKLPLIWLLLAPIVAALTVDDVPNINRAIVLFPAIEICVAYGFFHFAQKFSGKKKIIIYTLSSFLFLANFFYFQHQYFVHAAVHRTWYRNNGEDRLITELKQSYKQANKIIVTKSTGGIYPVILFFMKYDPFEYQKAGSPKDKAYSGFGKFFFAPQDCPSINRDSRFPTGKNLIFVDRGDCPDNNSIHIKKQTTILKEDGTKAFKIIYE